MNWVGFTTLVMREVGRFFSVYRQTVLPGVITTALYSNLWIHSRTKDIRDPGGTIYFIYSTRAHHDEHP